MKKVLKKLKTNKGFTIQDVVIAIIVLVLFAGVVGGFYTSIYKVQSQTKLDAMAISYGIQILENIDKISYEQVNSSQLTRWRNEYGINGMDVKLETSQYNSEDTIKKVKLTISYEFAGNTQTILLEKYKAKEL